MGRLIDADKLKAFIDAGHLRSRFEKCFSEDDVEKMIDEQTEAYNVEKVVEELKMLGGRYCKDAMCGLECCNCEHGSMMKEVLNIVKAGGTNEQR